MSRVMSTPTPPQTATRTPMMSQPSYEQVCMRAYEKWCKRGRPMGSPDSHWLEAEAQLRREMTMSNQRR